jgi:hypothetical protein
MLLDEIFLEQILLEQMIFEQNPRCHLPTRRSRPFGNGDRREVVETRISPNDFRTLFRRNDVRTYLQILSESGGGQARAGSRRREP